LKKPSGFLEGVATFALVPIKEQPSIELSRNCPWRLMNFSYDDNLGGELEEAAKAYR
jgi:hypothetical protein